MNRFALVITPASLPGGAWLAAHVLIGVLSARWTMSYFLISYEFLSSGEYYLSSSRLLLPSPCVVSRSD